VAKATITDASGNTLDIDELLGVETVEESDDEVAGVVEGEVLSADDTDDDADEQA
jgi:hypothetical protein